MGGMMYNLMERILGLKGNCWDYCVLWKLSEDHRFLEWFDCSCGGAHWNHHRHHESGRDEEEDIDLSTTCTGAADCSSGGVPCKDVMVQHPRRNSCQLLAQLPSSLPLDGINAEVLMSNEPRWVNYVKSSSSDSISTEHTQGSVETKVLIPAPGGLIELFSSNQITEDQSLVECILTQFDTTVFLEQESTTTAIMMNGSITDQQTNLSSAAITNTNTDEIHSSNPMSSSYYNTLNDHHLQNQQHSSSSYSPSTALESLNLSTSTCEATADRIRICNSAMNFLQQFNYLAAENSSRPVTNNNREDDDGFDDSIYQQQQQTTAANSFGSFGIGDEMEKSLSTAANHDLGVTPEPEQQQLGGGGGDDQKGVKNEVVGGSRGGGGADSLSDSDQLLDMDEDDSKGGGGGTSRRRSSNGKGQSKNLVAERKRRKKLNERLYNLRSLVPKISKLDRASILGDAIEYVMELKQQAKELEDELEQNSEEEVEEEDGINNGSLLIAAAGGGNNSNNNNNNPSMVEFGGMEFDHDKSLNGFFGGGSGMKRSRSEAVTGETSSNNNNNSSDKTQQMEVQVEVAPLEGNEFFIKVFGEQKRGGFVRLLEALTSLGLEIINVNVTSCISLVSYVFIVEKIDSEIVQADYLRDSLLEVTRNPAAAGEWSAAAMVGTAPPPPLDTGGGIEQQHFQYHHQQQLYGGGGVTSNHGAIGYHHLHHHRFHPFN